MSTDLNNALFQYALRLGDDRLILGHRLSEWCGHGPILEEDLAIANIGLDILGAATSFLKYAGEVEGKGRDEDKLAYFRNDTEFTNVLLVEQDNEDFAYTIVRQFFFDVYELFLLEELVNSKDEQLSAIAEKTIKETKYHVRHSTEWVMKLGDGTEESHRRMVDALDFLWAYTGELFEQDEIHLQLVEAGIAPDLNIIKEKWIAKVNEILKKATLPEQDANVFMHTGGRSGNHTEALGYILQTMQFLPRTYPEATW